jgi:hypothetical protein
MEIRMLAIIKSPTWVKIISWILLGIIRIEENPNWLIASLAFENSGRSQTIERAAIPKSWIEINRQIERTRSITDHSENRNIKIVGATKQ